MPNRIDVNFDSTTYSNAVKAATDTVAIINAAVPFVKPAEQGGGQSMGDGLGWIFVQRAYQVLSADRSLVHPKLLDFEGFTRDVEAAEKLLALRKILGNWVGNMEGAFIVLGRDLMESANKVRSALKALVDEDSSFQAAFDDLNFLYDNRAKRAADTAEQQKRIAELEKQIAEFQNAGNKA